MKPELCGDCQLFTRSGYMLDGVYRCAACHEDEVRRSTRRPAWGTFRMVSRDGPRGEPVPIGHATKMWKRD